MDQHNTQREQEPRTHLFVPGTALVKAKHGQNCERSAGCLQDSLSPSSSPSPSRSFSTGQNPVYWLIPFDPATVLSRGTSKTTLGSKRAPCLGNEMFLLLGVMESYKEIVEEDWPEGIMWDLCNGGPLRVYSSQRGQVQLDERPGVFNSP